MDHSEAGSSSSSCSFTGRPTHATAVTILVSEHEHAARCNTTTAPVCCLQLESDHGGQSLVILFDESTLVECHRVLKIRKLNNLKHSSITLPQTVDGIHGFHIGCYKKFVSLPALHRSKMLVAERNQDVATRTVRVPIKRSSIDKILNPSIRRGVFPQKCIFCNQRKKKLKGVEQRLINANTEKFENNMRKYAQWKKDNHLEARLNSIEFAMNKVKYRYHSICRVKYQNEAELAHKRAIKITEDMPNGHAVRARNEKAFEALKFFIQDTVISNQRMLSMRSVAEYYHHLLTEFGHDKLRDMRYADSGKLAKKLRRHFKERVIVKKITTGRFGMVIYSSCLTEDEIENMKEVYMSSTDTDRDIRSAALKLRDEILFAKKTPLPEDIPIEDK